MRTTFQNLFRTYGPDVGQSGEAAQHLPELAELAGTLDELQQVEQTARIAVGSRFPDDVDAGREALQIVAQRKRELGGPESFDVVYRRHAANVSSDAQSSQMLPVLADLARTPQQLQQVRQLASVALASRYEVDLRSGREALRIIARKS